MQKSALFSVKGSQRKKILSLLSEQLMKMFDDMYWDWIMGQDTFGFSTVDKTAAILRSAQES